MLDVCIDREKFLINDIKIDVDYKRAYERAYKETYEEIEKLNKKLKFCSDTIDKTEQNIEKKIKEIVKDVKLVCFELNDSVTLVFENEKCINFKKIEKISKIYESSEMLISCRDNEIWITICKK